MTQRSGSEPTAAGPAAPSSDVAASQPTALSSGLGPIAVVGRGRLGSVLFRALTDAGIPVTGPHPRGYRDHRDSGSSAPDAIVLLCVPDAAIAAAASSIPLGPLVAHCSGASGLSEIAPHRGFSMHPVMTFTHDTPSAVLHGIGAAIAGTDPPALETARRLVMTLGMLPFEVADADRVAYHAATAIAANFLVTLESAAGRLMQSAGLEPALLLPLARTALENWGRQGTAALTGPVARGDRSTVDSHRAVVSERVPDLLPLFDAMVLATQRIAGFDSTPAQVDTRSSTRNLI